MILKFSKKIKLYFATYFGKKGRVKSKFNKFVKKN